jgi:putative hydrolase of the HAD superfamily
MQHIRVIGLDADDTLWHNEIVFERVRDRYRGLLSRYHNAGTVDRALLASQARNIDIYGYGIKGFMLCSIETALELTEGKISGEEVRVLIELGREMLAHPVELLEGALETVQALARSHRLILITKGDLRDQERKLRKSGLAEFFEGIEIVSEKDPSTYADILRRHDVRPAEFLMVGNSVKSDVLPVLALGASAAHVPYPLLWPLENSAESPNAPGRFFQLEKLPSLLGLLR